jgi:glyceraldehyde-3-phosphate dehydrogenase/erythrose-4-phosphate dehydrogenase
MRAAQHKKQIQIVHINDPFITDLKYMQYMFYVSLNQINYKFLDFPKTNT